MPPFVFCRITKYWKDYWKKHSYNNIPLPEMLNKVTFKREAEALGIRTAKVHYNGFINECPRDILSRPDILIKKLEGKGQVYQQNTQSPTSLLKKWKREKIIVEEHIKHFTNATQYPIPFDYKIYTFKGEPKYVVIVNRNKNGRKATIYEVTHLLIEVSSQRDVTYLMGNVNHHKKPLPIISDKESAIPSQKHWDMLLKNAEKLGKTIFKDVFVRLDFFIDKDGPVLCELSPSPKGTWYWWFHQARYGDKKDNDVWKTHPDKERVLDRLCMEYKIKPSWLS